MTKKISKVIVYYTDGTFEEIKGGAPVVPHTPSTPDFRPDTQKVRDWSQPTYVQPVYQPARDQEVWPYPYRSNDIWCTTSTQNSSVPNKYSITSTGNGNVDLSSK